MKEIRLQKSIPMKAEVQRVLTLNAHCQNEYVREEDGIAVNGVIEVEAMLEGEQGREAFREQIALDIFAPQEKLGNEPFQVELSGCEGTIINQQLELTFLFQVSGMKEETTQEEEPDETMNPDSELSELHTLFEESDDTYVSCVMAVVKKDDTYASIARRYDVSEIELRACNESRTLEEKMLIRLPIVKNG